jgi:hypothetical protein
LQLLICNLTVEASKKLAERRKEDGGGSKVIVGKKLHIRKESSRSFLCNISDICQESSVEYLQVQKKLPSRERKVSYKFLYLGLSCKEAEYSFGISPGVLAE